MDFIGIVYAVVELSLNACDLIMPLMFAYLPYSEVVSTRGE